MRAHSLVTVMLATAVDCGGSTRSTDAGPSTDVATFHDSAPTDVASMDVACTDSGPPIGCTLPDAGLAGDATVFVGDGGWHETSYHGRLGIPLPVGLNGGALTAAVTVNGVSGPPLLVDTGSAATYLAPSLFPGAMVPTSCGTVGTLTVGGLTFTGASIIGDEDSGGGGVAGNLGADILCQFVATFDFRCQMLDLGGAYPSVGVTAPGTTVPLVLQGGGVAYPGCPQVFPQATRMIVPVNIEGTTRSMILDTGNSFILLAPSVYASIVADGRPQLTVLDATVDNAPLAATRLHTAAIGSANTTNIVAFEMPGPEGEDVASELGNSIAGIVGVNYLREFLVTANYPAGTLTLQQFTNEDHIHDEFVRVGIMLEPDSGNGYVVGQAFAGTVPASIAVGTEVVSVDGCALAGLGFDAADALLRGAAGQMKTVVIGTTTYHLTVTNLLPPSP